jgi:U3 small nucleolar RNA-associated protein 4
LVSSADGKTIFKGSLDGKITVLRHTTNPTGRQAWAKSHHRKIHSSEVKTMTAFDSEGVSVVVTGGGDKTAVVTPLREYGKEHGRSLISLPQQPPVTSARQARLLVSWWDKNINIWKIARRHSAEISPDTPRKLVAQLQLDVLESLSSVSISDDGKVLAACTSSEVKVFQLRKRPDADALAIRKMAVPEDMGALGARLVQFSPDCRWLAAVTPDNEVQVARITSVPDKPKQLQILDKLVELERQARQESPQSSFKQYERTVCRVAFSSDSAVLVTADLAGFLDSWVLEGHEDPTAPAVDIIPNKSANPASIDSSDDDSSDDDEEDYTFYGQHWADNPSARLLPQLPSFPLILSFRPSSSSEPVHVNGNPGVHSTRHNPHARSRALPSGPHHLWILTSTHEMYEFDVLAGRLTEWSRANPTSVLPEDFTQLKDRAMGAVWDVSIGEKKRERVWVYGGSWVCMLNVGGDLAPVGGGGAKRRRASEGRMMIPAWKKVKGLSGAGIKMPEGFREGLPSVIRRVDGEKSTEVVLDRSVSKAADDGEGDEEGDTRPRLTRLSSTAEDSQSQQLVSTEGEASMERKWWVTFKYRYILGMVPLLDDGNVEDDDKALEVVLVERPLWEASEGN